MVARTTETAGSKYSSDHSPRQMLSWVIVFSAVEYAQAVELICPVPQSSMQNMDQWHNDYSGALKGRR
jgi:hypothetical protein